MSEKDFYFKLFAREYLTDGEVRALPLAAQAILVRMWCVCCLDGSLPADAEDLAAACGVKQSDMRTHMRSVVRFFFVGDDGRPFSRRMNKEREARLKTLSGAVKAANTRWGKGKSDPEISEDEKRRDAFASAIEHASHSHNKDTPPTPSNEGAEKPKKPRKEKAPKERKDLGGDLGLLEELHGLHPARPGKAKGNRAKTLPRVQAVMVLHGLSREDCVAVVKAYQQHPNVLEGFVQLTETFWGENGHWLDCWTVVSKQRSSSAQANGAGPSGGVNGVSSTVAAPVVGAGALNSEIRSQEVGA